MVVTERPLVVSRTGKLKFYSPDAKHIVWKGWADLSGTEREVVRDEFPAFAAQYEDAGAPGRYADIIEYYAYRLEESKRVVREGRDGADRGYARGAASQYALAIEVLREAELIPEGSDCWFAIYPTELTTNVPPTFRPDHMDYEPGLVIRSFRHVMRLSDPRHIATMRRLVRNPQILPNRVLVERTDAEAKYPLLSEAGDFISWGDLDAYLRQEEALVKRA